MQIIDQQHAGPVASDEDAGQGLEEPLALPALVERFGLRQLRVFREQFGQEARQLRAPDGIQPPHQGRQERAAQTVDDGGKGQVPTGGVGVHGCGQEPLLARPAHHLLPQPRLADASLTAHHDAADAASIGGAPGCLQRLPFVFATHEVEARLTGRLLDLVAGRMDEPLVELVRRRARLDAQLLFQDRRTGVIDAQRGCPVAVEGVQPHEPPIGGFVEGIVVQQLLGGGDGVGIGAARFV